MTEEKRELQAMMYMMESAIKALTAAKKVMENLDWPRTLKITEAAIQLIWTIYWNIEGVLTEMNRRELDKILEDEDDETEG